MNILQTYQVNPERVNDLNITPHVQPQKMHPINIDSTLRAITGAGQATGRGISENADSAMNTMAYIRKEARMTREEKRRQNLAEIQQTGAQNELERQLKLQKAIDSGDAAEISRLDPKLGEQYAKTKNLELKNQANQAYMDETTGKPIALDAEGMEGMENDEVLARIDAEKEKRAALAGMSPFSEKARANLGKMSKAKREAEESEAKHVYGIMGGMESIKDSKRREQVWDKNLPKIKEYFKGSGMFEADDYDQESIDFGLKVISDTFAGFNKKGPLVEVNVPDSAKSIYDAQQKNFASSQAKEEGKQNVAFESDLNKSLETAQEITYKAERMIELVNKPDMRTGAAIPIEQGIRSVLTSFGFDGAENADADELTRIGNSFVQTEVNKFEGAISDGEREFARSLVGDITKGKESIRRYSMVQQALANRTREKARIYQEHIDGTGKGTSRGFERAWLRHQRSNPLFPVVKNTKQLDKIKSGTIFRTENGILVKKK